MAESKKRKKAKRNRKPGRPATKITPAQLRKAGRYALDGCQNGTICGLMGWEQGWLAAREDILRFLLKKRQERKAMLRKAQTKNAVERHNHTMQIFLGVNELGQRDTKTVDIEPHTIADIAAVMGIGKKANDRCD